MRKLAEKDALVKAVDVDADQVVVEDGHELVLVERVHVDLAHVAVQVDLDQLLVLLPDVEDLDHVLAAENHVIFSVESDLALRALAAARPALALLAVEVLHVLRRVEVQDEFGPFVRSEHEIPVSVVHAEIFQRKWQFYEQMVFLRVFEGNFLLFFLSVVAVVEAVAVAEVVEGLQLAQALLDQLDLENREVGVARLLAQRVRCVKVGRVLLPAEVEDLGVLGETEAEIRAVGRALVRMPPDPPIIQIPDKNRRLRRVLRGQEEVLVAVRVDLEVHHLERVDLFILQ